MSAKNTKLKVVAPKELIDTVRDAARAQGALSGIPNMWYDSRSRSGRGYLKIKTGGWFDRPGLYHTAHVASQTLPEGSWDVYNEADPPAKGSDEQPPWIPAIRIRYK
jgi:hypothetical protein